MQNWLTRLVSPHLGLAFYTFEYSAIKNIVIVEIPAAFIQPTSFAGIEYIRVGSYRQELRKHPQLEQKLWNSLNQVSFEQSVSHEQGLHFKGLRLLMEIKGLEFSENMFSSLRLIDRNGKFNNLGLVLSDENPYIVKFAVYANNKMDFKVKKEFSGSWAVMLDQVLEYSNLYNDVSARVIGSNRSRTEIQSYPDPSLREAVVNAFGHLDFSFPSNIKIEFFPDKVEIASPGSLFRVSMNEVLNGRQSFRNPNLIFILNKLNFIENYATGLREILQAYSENPVQPSFQATDNFFVVELPNTNKMSASGHDSGHDSGQVGGLDIISNSSLLDQIVSYCSSPRTREEIQELCGIRSRDYFANHFLKPLLESNRIVMTIPNKPKSKNQKYVQPTNSKDKL